MLVWFQMVSAQYWPFFKVFLTLVYDLAGCSPPLRSAAPQFVVKNSFLELEPLQEECYSCVQHWE